MARITYIGGENDGDLNHNIWPSLAEKKDYRFPLNEPVEVTDRHIIAKASTNRYFRVEGGGGEVQNDKPLVTATNADGKDIEAEIVDESDAGDPVQELIDAADGMSFFAFKSAATKYLGADVPAKKDDILEALKAL